MQLRFYLSFTQRRKDCSGRLQSAATNIPLRFCTYACHILCFFILFSCEEEKFSLETMLEARGGIVSEVTQQADKFEVQILYTQIDRDSDNQPHFTSHSFRLDKHAYFYPASTVKMAAAFLALEKINKLNVEGVNKFTPMLTDSAYERQSAVLYDSTAENYLPTVAHYAKKIFIVSDNDAFNRLYEFIGQESLNRELWVKGFNDLRLVHRLSIFLTPEQNRYTNPVSFLENDHLLYQQPLVYNENPIPFPPPISKGKGEIIDDSLVMEPKDFASKNYFPLHTQQEMLKCVIFPNSVIGDSTFDFTEEDYRFLYQYMSQLPGETTYPAYDSASYWDGYAKFFMYGDTKDAIPPHIRIFNKIGAAYGYLTDNAYVVDFENKVEFLLSATVFVNENQIFNDGNYEYDEIGYPFLADLGRMLYEYELKRKRAFEPDLSRFKLAYDK